jgi:hypothetical protein
VDSREKDAVWKLGSVPFTRIESRSHARGMSSMIASSRWRDKGDNFETVVANPPAASLPAGGTPGGLPANVTPGNHRVGSDRAWGTRCVSGSFSASTFAGSRKFTAIGHFSFFRCAAHSQEPSRPLRTHELDPRGDRRPIVREQSIFGKDRRSEKSGTQEKEGTSRIIHVLTLSRAKSPKVDNPSRPLFPGSFRIRESSPSHPS